MPLILGLVFIGGFLVLLVSTDKEDEKSKDLEDKNTKSPEGDQVNVEEIRRLRRELRHQLSIKKKSSSNK